MVGSRLDHPVYRLLPEPRREADGRMDRDARRWRRAHQTRRHRLKFAPQRFRANQTSSTPTTAKITPFRVHMVSPSMKLSAGPRMMSSPCNAHTPPPRIIATPPIAKITFKPPIHPPPPYPPHP